jgi:endoglucanase
MFRVELPLLLLWFSFSFSSVQIIGRTSLPVIVEKTCAMKKSLLNTTLLVTAVAVSLFVAPLVRGDESKPSGQAHFGVNIAGAEFGGHILPGTYGTHYIYPAPELLDYYQKKGRTLIRLPFHWERIQRSLNSELDEEELARLKAVLRAAGERKMRVLLDVHNYGRYKFTGEETPQIIGSERVPYSAFADLWSRLATAVKDEPAVYAYGLMNEPHDMEDDTRWPRAAQAAIDAIRRVDQKTIIMVSGDAWSSARGWRTGINKDLHEKVRDPQNNLVFEAHCYFDKDNSGSYKKGYDDEGATPDIGIEYVRPFVEWCREKNVRGFIGEYGVPDTDTRWLVTMDRFLAYLRENNMSSAYWAGGPWWGKYALSIEPQDARARTDAGGAQTAPPDRPQMLILRQYPG